MDLCTCDVLEYFKKYLNPCLIYIVYIFTLLALATLFDGPQNAVLANCTLPAFLSVTTTWAESANLVPNFGSTKAVNSPLVIRMPHLSAEST